ncbi:hypothetical protein TNCV_4711781 [Trichonephila clavipes]|nr:hypothetical protein TNCV_4711781 [Trichonephila clavipes]
MTEDNSPKSNFRAKLTPNIQSKPLSNSPAPVTPFAPATDFHAHHQHPRNSTKPLQIPNRGRRDGRISVSLFIVIICSELVAGIAGMGKLPDLDAFDSRQIVGARRRSHSISEIVRQLGFSSFGSIRISQVVYVCDFACKLQFSCPSGIVVSDADCDGVLAVFESRVKD